MNYFSIKKEYINEIIIERSRFITYSLPVKSVGEAREYLENIRKKHSDATHNCYAYKLKDGSVKFSDDGEPSGTAGAPIQEAISVSNLTDIIVIVTRYFGGIKLGAGGLTRAYFGCAKEGLDKAERVEYIMADVYSVELSYEDFYGATSFFNQSKVKVVNKEFDAGVKVIFAVAKGEEVEDKIASLINKKPSISRLRGEYEVF